MSQKSLIKELIARFFPKKEKEKEKNIADTIPVAGPIVGKNFYISIPTNKEYGLLSGGNYLLRYTSTVDFGLGVYSNFGIYPSASQRKTPSQNGMFSTDSSGNPIVKTSNGVKNLKDIAESSTPSLFVNIVKTVSPTDTLNIDLAASQHWVINLSENLTITFTNPPANENESEQMVLEFLQDGTGGRTVSYSQTITPAAPVINTTSLAREVVTGFVRRTAGGIVLYNLYKVG